MLRSAERQEDEPVLTPAGKSTSRLRARALWEELDARLSELRVLEHEIRQADQDVRERLRAISVALAIEHLERAMAALLGASAE
jgi:hypothetical protein